MFDYWATDNGADNDGFNSNQGINRNHQLKFNTGTSGELINSWTGKGKGPRTGMVMNTLQNGYPSLAKTTLSGWANTGGDGLDVFNQTVRQESLAYLFDSSSQSGKQGYFDVQGLLQVDSNGYYYYNASSAQTTENGGGFDSANYATFDPDTNSFTLYDTYAVNKTGTYSPLGQFFPFSDASTVFSENADHSALERKNVQSNSSSLNHYFGMHMSTQFVQQYGGHTEENGDIVTYEFSGDDDVWIYIDDVLVGDLGGIHDAARITIDFSTGEIHVYNVLNTDVTPENMKTLRACYRNANADGDYKWNDDGNGDTFADNTYHTLDFFYLERGYNDSNMSLRYNLVSIPETELSKVDQEGNFIDGATFNVYDTTDGKEISDDNLICEDVVTEKDGTVTLIGQDDYPITLDQLWNNGIKNITLVETDTPDGYRAAREIPLYIQHYTADQTANKKEINLLLSSDPWTTGAYAQPKVTATTTDGVKVDQLGELDRDQLQSGVLFAVIEQQGSDGKWYPVTGNALDGWDVSESNAMSDIIAAGQSTNAVFTISTSGAYQTEIENLPGRIQDYEFFSDADSKSGTNYRGAYYYTKARTLAGATEDNTYAVTNPNTFDRQFSARIYLSNILNRVLVQKTNDNGKAVDGATMSLFKADQVNVTDDGSVVLKEGVTAENAIQSGVTRTLSKAEGDSVDLDGAVIFSNLEPGIYYAVETVAPSGYALNQNFAKIIVDNTGVYADAGTDDDGISVTRGVGRIMRSMVQFATADDIDATLHDIVATPQLGTQKADGSWEWTQDTSASTQHLQFADDGDAVLDYKMMSEDTYTVEAGIPGLSIAQCDDADHATTPRQNIGADITNLFTGVTIVHINDQQVGALDVTKTVTGDDTDRNATFDFTMTFAHPAVEGQTNDAALTQDEATAAGMQLAIGDGEAAGVTVDASGTVTFQLKAGQTAHFTTIPAGVIYQVTEKPTANFTTSYDESQAGTITFNATASTTVTNTWAPSAKIDGAANLMVTKNVVGTDWDDDWSFNFAIAPYGEETEKAVEDGTVTMPDPASVSISAADVNDDGVHQKSFGDITFSAEGTYQFVVTENDFDIECLAKDESQKIVTVNVAPNQTTGQLEAALVTKGNDASDALVFTNTADLTFDTEHTFKVVKELKSQFANLVNAEKGAYGFTITAQDSVVDGVTSTTATEAAGKIGIENGISTSFSSDALEFTGNNTWSATMHPITDDITFTAADRGKTFTWTIKENKPDQVPAGYVYDESEHTLSIAVSSDTSAALSLDIALDGKPVADNTVPTVTFTNRVDVIDAEIPVTKTTNVETDKTFIFDVKLDSAKNADGNDITDGAWMLKDNVLTAFNADGETFDIAMSGSTTVSGSFKNLALTQPGTYTFTVKENVPENAEGWTYDTNDFTYVVKVERNDAGFLTSQGSIKDAQSIEFENTYSATGSLVLPGLTKTLDGRDWMEGDAFTFTLTGKNVSGGDVAEDIGFTLPNTTEVKLTKADADAAANADGTTEGVKVPFSFDAITFSQTGTYEFTVTEGNSGAIHVNNASGSSVKYQVTVSDKTQDGQFEIGEPIIVTELGSSDFVNTYNPSTATATLSAIKTLNDSSMGISPNMFEFQITGLSAPDGVTAPMPSGVTQNDDGAYTVKNATDGEVDFGTFTFDTEGTYVYQVSEINAGKTGMTYDSTVYTVVYKVTDNPQQGMLVGTPTIYKGESQDEGAKAEAITFANTYHPKAAPATADFSGAKTVTDEHGSYGTLKGGEFTFKMENLQLPEGVTDIPWPDKATISSDGATATVKNDADGSFDFGSFTFAESGTYQYRISEVNDDQDGVSYDGTGYLLAFTVEDQNGQLTVTSQAITGPNGTVGADGLDFTNIYNDGEVSYQIGGTKLLDVNGYNGASLEAGQYTFVLLDADGNEMARATNGEGGSFAFDPITYTEPGTHLYTVHELGVDGQPGTGGTDGDNVTYSTESYQVTVTVESTDEGRGLSATADVQNSDIVFTNTYEPTSVVVGPSGSAQIAGIKALSVADGGQRDLTEGEFTFELLDSTGNQVATATNAADGSFIFGDLTFDAAGTYHYTVAEVNDGKGGVAYDTALYGVTVTVTEDADARALTAEVAYTKDGQSTDTMTFTNGYTAASTTAMLGVSKELQSGTLADGQFTFELTGSEGAPMPEKTTATNDASGAVSFGAITFDAVGEYDYTITEINDGQEGVTYDKDADRTIHVSVTDDGVGHLVAVISYGADGSHFVNVGTPEEQTDGGDSEKDTPNGNPSDGDASNGGSPAEGPIETLAKTSDTWLPVLLVVIVVASAAVGVFSAKRMKKPSGRL